MGVLYRYNGKDGDYEWEGVSVEPYETGGAVGGTKCILIGHRDDAYNFGLRYYEVVSGGQTSFDNHEHDHGIFILKGEARVLMGWEVVEVGVGDVLYISPREQHQLENIGDEPLGFLCVVPPRD